MVKVPEPDCDSVKTKPPGDDVAVYESMVAPPFDAGAVKVSETVVESTTVAVPIVGAPGAVTPPPAEVTSIVKVERTVPLELVADTVKTVETSETLGVPEIVPELTSKVKPDGNEGEIAQLETAPPELVAVSVVSAVPVTVDAEEAE